MDLKRFDRRPFNRDRRWVLEAIWIFVSAATFSTWLPGSAWRRGLLRLFGASIGRRVIVKPHVQIKFPWKLTVGNFSWIGERAWIDNLDEVVIGDHACISQGVYLCTGNHDWAREDFALVTKPITIGNQAWIGARVTVGPGVRVAEGAVIALGAVATSDVEAWAVCAGNPARVIRRRTEGAPAEPVAKAQSAD